MNKKQSRIFLQAVGKVTLISLFDHTKVIYNYPKILLYSVFVAVKVTIK